MWSEGGGTLGGRHGGVVQLAVVDGPVEASVEEAAALEGQSGAGGALLVAVHHHLAVSWTEVCGQTDVVGRLCGRQWAEDEERGRHHSHIC